MPDKPAYRCHITARHAQQRLEAIRAEAMRDVNAGQVAGERLLAKACVALLAITPGWTKTAADARWELARLASEKARR